ncbi:MAG: hypothetical protein HY403_04395 [Elusimicrobia bacterium]|nr:hypothetical protein [Elusimicrobiota bacterium]
MRVARSRAGQIVIPALLLFPTLFLFVYLIYETAKLSREKIKHQFAMDAAVFVEATNYSDFLNRTAYVNGAFPMRIFEQGYDDFPAECEGKTADCPTEPGPRMYSEILFKNGIFPRSRSGHKQNDADYWNSATSWDIAYDDVNFSGKNSEDPELQDPVVLFTIDNANKFWHPWDLATEVYKLYVQVFSLLGSVENAQKQVLERLTGGSTPHSFLQKSYWLNTGDTADYGQQLAQSFDVSLGSFRTEAHCVRNLIYHGNKHMGGTGIQQYRVFGTDPPQPLPDSEGCGGGGLFQLQTVDQGAIRRLRSVGDSGYPGLSLTMRWQLPGRNYFNVEFGNMPRVFRNGYPELHTTVSVGANNPNARVWPLPTPKFQVRQFP